MKLRSCRSGHPYRPGSYVEAVQRKWLKETGEWKEYRVRKCRRCQRVWQKLSSRRRRLLGKQANYQQWFTARLSLSRDGRPACETRESTVYDWPLTQERGEVTCVWCGAEERVPGQEG